MEHDIPEGYYVSGITREELPGMLRFLILEIYRHFNFTAFTKQDFAGELNRLLAEDMAYFDHSVYYVLRRKSDKSIQACIRTTWYDGRVSLPIEKLFDLKISGMRVTRGKQIWHLGRFVISGSLPSHRISVLKKLLFNAFYPVSISKNAILFAECDSKLVRTLSLMGIDSLVLGSPIEYICSETLPICITSECLKPFITRNAGIYYSERNQEDVQFFRQWMHARKKVMV